MSVRIHELAKKIGLTNPELIDLLKERGYKVKTASSTVDNISAESLVEEFAAKAEETARAQEAAAASKAAEEAAAAKPVKPSGPFVKSKADIEREREEREAAARRPAAAPAAPVPPPAPARASAPPPVKAPPVPPPVSARASGPVSSPPVPPPLGARTGGTAPSVLPPGLRPGTTPAARRPVVPNPGLRPPAGAEPPPPTAVVRPPLLRRDSEPEVTYPGMPTRSGPAAPVAKAPPAAPPPPPPARSPAPLAPPVLPAPATKDAPQAAAKTEGDAAIDGPPTVAEPKLLQLRPPIVVRDFAQTLGLRPFRLISELMELGIFASMNQAIEPEVAARVAEKHGFLLEVRHRGEGAPQAPKKKEPVIDEDDERFLEPRPPVVCILGHVDHGKTTLLDSIRSAKVASGEAGGITQHIGAYQVIQNERKITFLDTPGHAAFSQMRARGALVTDIAILVVAADDGFMPQTDEALGHARRANVPVVVAINKVDAPGAKIDRVKQQMQERGIAPEDWGGETLCAAVSGLKGTNIPALLEAVLLQAEIMEIKANPKATPEGIVIEAQKEIGQGSTATVIVQKGTLKPGDSLVCGPHYAKVRALISDRGERLKSAPPSTPVKIVGWSSTPESGQIFRVVKNDREAKRIAADNELELKRAAVREANSEGERVTSAEALLAAINQTQRKSFRALVKADVYGTAEALASSLEGIRSEKITMEVVDMGVGPISKNDIDLASSAGGAIIAFNIGLENGVQPYAKHHGVRIITHNIIYELIDQVKEAMVDQLPPEFREQKTGAAEIRAVFPVAKGIVAGCMVTEGRINRDAGARLLRKGRVEEEGRIVTLRRFKDDVTEVRAGYECGIRLNDVDTYEVGDVIETFEILKLKPSL